MKKNKSQSLIRVFFLKEKVFWNRIKTLKQKLGWFWLIIALIFLTIFHYCFALMSISFEFLLWLVNRPIFRVNMKKMYGECVLAGVI